MSLLYPQLSRSNIINYHDELGGRITEMTFRYYNCFCGESGYKIVSHVTRHENNFFTVQCKSCGTLRINPYLTDESIDLYYKDIYGKIKRQGISSPELYEKQKNTSKFLCNFLTKNIHITESTKILDFGGGTGGRLDEILSLCPPSIIEHDLQHYEYALNHGFKPHNSNDKYDIIVLSHVLEHINDPVSFLRNAICPLLVDGGFLYVEVPYLSNKRSILPDLHLAHKFYFTEESLDYLLYLVGFVNKFNHKDSFAKGVLCQIDNTKSLKNTPSFLTMKQSSDDVLHSALQRRDSILRVYSNLKSSYGQLIASGFRLCMKMTNFFKKFS
jgi:hypothetical protein